VRQATLVAFYGSKRAPLAEFLGACQDRLRRSVRRLGSGIEFRPYALAQIHATILGLERSGRVGLHNRNLYELSGRPQAMRLPELFEFILKSDHLPLQVQLGGFEDRDYPFQSRGARPYSRSFSVQGRTAVVIGWPVEAVGAKGVARSRGRASGLRAPPGHPFALDALRRSARRFHVLHRWHREPTDVDNDLYLRLGSLDADLSAAQRQLVEAEIRRALASAPPLTLELTASDLAVVSYPANDETLPFVRSKAVRLPDHRLRDDRFIAQLYA
jgi:hypothetical protein